MVFSYYFRLNRKYFNVPVWDQTHKRSALCYDGPTLGEREGLGKQSNDQLILGSNSMNPNKKNVPGRWSFSSTLPWGKYLTLSSQLKQTKVYTTPY